MVGFSLVSFLFAVLGGHCLFRLGFDLGLGIVKHEPLGTGYSWFTLLNSLNHPFHHSHEVYYVTEI